MVFKKKGGNRRGRGSLPPIKMPPPGTGGTPSVVHNQAGGPGDPWGNAPPPGKPPEPQYEQQPELVDEDDGPDEYDEEMEASQSYFDDYENGGIQPSGSPGGDNGGGGGPSEKDSAPAPTQKKGGRAKERENIFAAPLDMTEEYIVPCYVKSNQAIRFIDSVLSKYFMFASLSKKERKTLIGAMQPDVVLAGCYIIKQGDVGDYFYVVDGGYVDFYVGEKKVGQGTRGGSFGELALLYDCPRSASCIAITKCRLWKIDQKTFRYMLASNTQQKGIVNVLRKVPFLAELDNKDITRIVDSLTTITYNAGERIISKGEKGENFYIIQEGTAKVHEIGFGDSKYVDQHIGSGDFFGERALLTGDPRGAHVTATSTPCTCLCLSRETFDQVLGPLQGLIERAMKKRTLLGVPLISKSEFQPHELAKLTDCMIEKTFPKGTSFAQAGKPLIQNLFIIRTGNVKVIDGITGQVHILKEADYFNDKYIKEPDGFISRETIVCETGEVSCGILNKRDIERVIGNIARLGQPLEETVTDKLDKTIQFTDLTKIRILGVGTFGKVWLVTCKKKQGIPYALKQLSKREIIGHKQVEGVVREKNIMSQLDHPFVVNLITTFQDDHSLYMVIELVQGGELFSVIHTNDRDGIPNGNARFYAACILESLSHLHNRSVCYRDLKPENLLIDQFGYCVLVDLGFAKVVLDKTYTLCGTAEYLSPEIILSKGHDKGADYWAFGVLIYEMIVGKSPFYEDGVSQAELFKAICSCEYYFPESGLMDPKAEDLIEKLLIIKQSHRLGCMAAGDNEIRGHPWFSIINFEKLVKKQWPTPWKPNLKDPLDSSHFDSYEHLEGENQATKHKPLSPEEQEGFKDF